MGHGQNGIRVSEPAFPHFCVLSDLPALCKGKGQESGLQGGEEERDSDDEAPEEISLVAGRQAQAALREMEQTAASAASRRKRHADKQGIEENPAGGATSEDPDILPDHVLARLADT